MTTENDTRPLFIFEMANNHMGSVEHGLRIIREFADTTRAFAARFRLAFKFQYRQLDTFIHPDFKNRSDLKYVKRFQETRLTPDEFLQLKNETVRQGMLTVCTPFDEASVDLIVRQEFDCLKIASCSCTDWPLLEHVAKAGKPLVISCAGVSLDELDKVVSFFQHRDIPFTLMHCVAEYPTADAHLQLNQIDLLRTRYPGVPVGFSTHEDPGMTESVRLAVAKGAVAFEKHVGVPTSAWPLNAYSATPEQACGWLAAAARAFEMCGVQGARAPFSAKEVADLAGLRRGVFAKSGWKAGALLRPADCLLAIPTVPGQITANDLSKYREFKLLQDVPPLAPLMASAVAQTDHREEIFKIVVRVKHLLDKGRVVVPGRAEFEISHHYGIQNFDEFGITMITVVNREYCKKLIVVLPGQKHPEQYHKRKEETFHVLYGEILLTLNGQERLCRKGDVVVVEKGVLHAFTSKKGAVMEEISSSHYRDDSYYTDPEITKNPNRKTIRTYWLDTGSEHGR